MDKVYVLAGAIVVGCGLIGLGLYAGLSARTAPEVAPIATSPVVLASVTSSPIDSASPTAEVVPASGLTAPATTVAASTDAVTPEAAAKKALEKEKTERLVPKCWAPALATAAEPKTASYTVSLGFDSQGREVVRGVSEIRGKSRADVVACLRAQPPSLIIPAPGRATTVELPLEFP